MISTIFIQHTVFTTGYLLANSVTNNNIKQLDAEMRNKLIVPLLPSIFVIQTDIKVLFIE